MLISLNLSNADQDTVPKNIAHKTPANPVHAYVSFSMEPSYHSLFINIDHAKVIKTGLVYFQTGKIS